MKTDACMQRRQPYRAHPTSPPSPDQGKPPCKTAAHSTRASPSACSRASVAPCSIPLLRLSAPRGYPVNSILRRASVAAQVIPDRRRVQSHPFCCALHRHTITVEHHPCNPSLVLPLGSVVRPTAVVGRVAEIVVDPIQRHPRRSLAHIIKKSFIALPPRADRYPAVVVVPSVSCVRTTPGAHRFPNPIGPGPARPGGMAVRHSRPPLAAAVRGSPALQVAGLHQPLRPACAETKPLRYAFCRLAPQRRPVAKGATSQIFKPAHTFHYSGPSRVTQGKALQCREKFSTSV